MATAAVGIHEFRSDMAGFIASGTPLAITRRGQTVGYFIPSPGQREANIVALGKAGKALDKLLQVKGVDTESVVGDFKAARRRISAPSRKLNAKSA